MLQPLIHLKPFNRRIPVYCCIYWNIISYTINPLVQQTKDLTSNSLKALISQVCMIVSSELISGCWNNLEEFMLAYQFFLIFSKVWAMDSTQYWKMSCSLWTAVLLTHHCFVCSLNVHNGWKPFTVTRISSKRQNKYKSNKTIASIKQTKKRSKFHLTFNPTPKPTRSWVRLKHTIP